MRDNDGKVSRLYKMAATLQMRQGPDCQADMCDYSGHVVCPAGADQLSTQNLAWIQLHGDSMLMSHIIWSQTFQFAG